MPPKCVAISRMDKFLHNQSHAFIPQLQSTRQNKNLILTLTIISYNNGNDQKRKRLKKIRALYICPPTFQLSFNYRTLPVDNRVACTKLENFILAKLTSHKAIMLVFNLMNKNEIVIASVSCMRSKCTRPWEMDIFQEHIWNEQNYHKLNSNNTNSLDPFFLHEYHCNVVLYHHSHHDK